MLNRPIIIKFCQAFFYYILKYTFILKYMLNHPIIITLCQATKYNFKQKNKPTGKL